MLVLNLQSTDPFFNLALEEFLLKHRREEFFLLYVNVPSVIIGKHQVAHRETDTNFVTANNIPVVRRISGGGTVFHDEGNLNFSFISRSTEGKQVDFRKYTFPVIRFLESLGVEAKFEGKNDLKVNGLKISGNSEHVQGNRVLHHGTLLYDTRLEFLKGSIRKDTSHYLTRAVSSNPSSVMNLKELIPVVKGINDFRLHMLNFFLNEKENILYSLSPAEIKEIESLSQSKYRTWEWNFAYGPEYIFNNQLVIGGILHTCRIFVKDGIIREAVITGSQEMETLAEKITGCRHMTEDLEKVSGMNNFVSWMF